MEICLLVSFYFPSWFSGVAVAVGNNFELTSTIYRNTSVSLLPRFQVKRTLYRESQSVLNFPLLA